jgi:uncharacterized membrane protein
MFGGFGFLFGFNAMTLFWFLEGRYNPHWFDQPPYNFYTGVVSWFAIVMSILILGSDKRSRAQEEHRQRKDEHMTEAILHLSESNQQILKYLVEQETGIDLDEMSEVKV